MTLYAYSLNPLYSDDPKLISHWTPMIFLVDLYTQSLLTMGDDEFFSSTTSTNAPRNPLTLDELTVFSRQLMNIALSLYMRNDQMYTQEGPISGLPIGWEIVREKVTKCLQAVHAREYVIIISKKETIMNICE